MDSRFNELVANGDFYSAHQECKTHFNRISAKHNSTFEAFKALLNGALLLLQHNQFNAASDLARQAIDFLRSQKVPCTDPHTAFQSKSFPDHPYATHVAQDIASLLDHFYLQVFGKHSLPYPPSNPTPDSVQRLEEYLTLIKSCIRWFDACAQSTLLNTSSPDLTPKTQPHQKWSALAALASVHLHDFAQAQKYYLDSDQPQQYASFLIYWARNEALDSEFDLFMTRAVLLVLSKYSPTYNTHALQFANSLIQTMLQAQVDNPPSKIQHSSSSSSSSSESSTPLFNFVQLLLEIIPLGPQKKYLFIKLRSVYAKALQVDPYIAALLEKIGTQVFHLQVQPQSSLLQSLMGGLMAGSPFPSL